MLVEPTDDLVQLHPSDKGVVGQVSRRMTCDELIDAGDADGFQVGAKTAPESSSSATHMVMVLAADASVVVGFVP